MPLFLSVEKKVCGSVHSSEEIHVHVHLYKHGHYFDVVGGVSVVDVLIDEPFLAIDSKQKRFLLQIH